MTNTLSPLPYKYNHLKHWVDASPNQEPKLVKTLVFSWYPNHFKLSQKPLPKSKTTSLCHSQSLPGPVLPVNQGTGGPTKNRPTPI